VFFAVFEPCVVIAFAGVPFPCCFFSALFKLWLMMNNRSKKTTRELFDAILFSLCRFVSSCFPFVTPIVLLDMNQMRHLFGAFLKKITK